MPLGAARFGLLGGVADLGKLELIETQTYSGAVSFVDFTSIQESTYNVHFVTFNNFQPVDNLPSFLLRFYESGVLETGSVYQTAFQYGATNGTFGEAKSTGRSSITVGGAQTTSTGGAINGYFYIYNAGDSSKYTFVSGHSMDLDNYAQVPQHVVETIVLKQKGKK